MFLLSFHWDYSYNQKMPCTETFISRAHTHNHWVYWQHLAFKWICHLLQLFWPRITSTMHKCFSKISNGHTVAWIKYKDLTKNVSFFFLTNRGGIKSFLHEENPPSCNFHSQFLLGCGLQRLLFLRNTVHDVPFKKKKSPLMYKTC